MIQPCAKRDWQRDREQSQTILTACQNGKAEHLDSSCEPGQGSQT